MDSGLAVLHQNAMTLLTQYLYPLTSRHMMMKVHAKLFNHILIKILFLRDIMCLIITMDPIMHQFQQLLTLMIQMSRHYYKLQHQRAIIQLQVIHT